MGSPEKKQIPHRKQKVKYASENRGQERSNEPICGWLPQLKCESYEPTAVLPAPQKALHPKRMAIISDPPPDKHRGGAREGSGRSKGSYGPKKMQTLLQ